MKLENRKTVFTEYPAGYLNGTSGYIEVTEWTNGDGHDIHIHDGKNEKVIVMPYWELNVIKKCVKLINKSYEKQHSNKNLR